MTYPVNMNAQNLVKMVRLLLGFLGSWFRSQKDLALENVALRQQLSAFKHKQPRPVLTCADRAFWVLLRAVWSKWSNSLIIVSPDTVVRWHRKGFRLYWDALSRKCRKPGRPRKDHEIRQLIRRMAIENPTWRAPHIHGELLMLGYDVSKRTVSRYLPKSSRARTMLVTPIRSIRTVIPARQTIIHRKVRVRAHAPRSWLASFHHFPHSIGFLLRAFSRDKTIAGL